MGHAIPGPTIQTAAMPGLLACTGIPEEMALSLRQLIQQTNWLGMRDKIPVQVCYRGVERCYYRVREQFYCKLLADNGMSPPADPFEINEVLDLQSPRGDAILRLYKQGVEIKQIPLQRDQLRALVCKARRMLRVARHWAKA